MKRFITILSTVLFFVTGISQNSFAQSDDVYYDPNKDKGVQNNSQQNNSTNYNSNQQSNTNQNNYQQPTQTESADKTDGYSNDSPAYKYDPRDNRSSNTNDYYASDATSYDEDYDSYYYTTNLHRYYNSNYGVSYYNYSFTPSYYYGYSNWNNRVVVSYSPWYNDSWWRWNHHRHNTIYVYDPFYDPYYDWNMGWNSAYYTYSWGNPYWGNYSCNYGWGYNSWAYNWGSGCGYGGYYNPYYYGYNSGYNNGYYNGYYNGYNNGYHDGYTTASGYNPYYYYGPRHHKVADAPGNTTGSGTSGTKGNVSPVTSGTSVSRTPVDMHNVDIPKEGIQKPINQNSGAVKPRDGVQVNANTASPYNEKKPDVVVKPSEPVTQAPNGWQEKNVQQRDNNVNVAPRQEPKAWQQSNDQQPVERAQPKENNGWTSTPPQNWDNHPAQRDNNINERPRDNNFGGRTQQQPQENRPQENRWNEQPRQVEQPRVIEQPRNYEQQRPMEQPRQIEQRREVPQQRNFEQRPMEQRNFNSAPQRSFEQPHNNFQSAPQRSSPSNGGGGMRRH